MVIGLLLAALKAASEMAYYLNDNELSNEYLSIYEKGKNWIETNLFNGEYFIQMIDLGDKSILDEFRNEIPGLTGKDVLTTYWCVNSTK